MSKKIMKRSLALGALMAFVITGSAMAASGIVAGELGAFDSEGKCVYTGDGNVEWKADSNVTGTTHLQLGKSDSTLIEKLTVSGFDTITLDGIHTISSTAPAINAVNVYKNAGLTFENIGSIVTAKDADLDVGFQAQGGNISIYAQNVKLDNFANALLAQSGGQLTVDVSEDIYISSDKAYSMVYAGNFDTTDRTKVSNVTLLADNDIIINAPDGTGLCANSTTYPTGGANTGKNGIVVDAGNKLKVTAKNAIVAQYGDTVSDASVSIEATIVELNAIEKGIKAVSNGAVEIVADNTIISVTNTEDNAYGIYAEKTSQVDLGGTTINITADSTNGEARAVNARGESGTYDAAKGSVINLGNADTENINVTVKGSGYGLISQYQGSAINVLGDNLTITGTGDVIGIIAQNQTVTTEGKVNTDTNYSDNAKVIIGEGTATKIDVANGTGISAMSMGKVSVAGDLYVNAKTAVEARGDSIIEINKAGNKTVQLNGDILFDYADNSQTTINAAVDVNLANDKSYFKGSIIADPSTKQGEVAGMKLALSNGATWELTGASVLNNAAFGKDSVLKIDGATFEESKGVYALNGTSDADVLQVEAGAKLVVDGIDEKTYNVAKGFETISESKWDIDNLNALMEGEWKETNGLQLVVSAKEVSEMASDTGISESTAGLVQSIIENAGNASTDSEKAAVDFIENVLANNSSDAAVGNAINAATKMAEAGGNSATAANIVKNVTGVTNDRISFNCGHSAPHKGGHGVGLFEEGSGADIWVEYVHGKDEVEDMPSSAGATSYEGQFNGIVMGVDFKKVNKFQSGVAFNYGEGDTNSIGGVARTHSDYDFWGIGYYGNIHNDDSNVIFDVNYAKTESDVTQYNSNTTFEASPETTTWSAGVKVEKLYQNENVQIVPYTGLRYMSIDSDDYSTKCGAFNYSMDRQDIWLLPLGVSIRQEVANDNGWTVSPRVDLSYIWAFGDTNSNMEVKSPFAGVSQLGYDVMDDGSFLGLVGIEAHKGQWGYGVSYSYQKGDHSTSKKWYVDVNYSF